MILVRNLGKAFGKEVLFSNLNLDIPKGKMTAITGISGKGKTTLLRILAGLDKEYQGSIEGMPTQIAWVFQEDRLLPWLNLYDNLALVLPDKKSAFSAILKVLTLVGLQDDKYKMITELSGGMQRRAALARGLLNDAECMFLDEPFTGLDDNTKLSVAQGVFAYAKERERTVLLVTHDKEIAVFADNIINLDSLEQKNAD